ncbi:P-loop containing nucleoside triphosphate hydrolase protein [Clavulina sp. PMI_390]|nr:P-loop containing nucleoside triphosphate hydrolase protein [Clavulina sp. PMI_390]
MVCQNLVRDGYCPDGNACSFSHFLKLCNLCNVTLVTEHSFNAHICGKEHSRRLYHASGARSGVCAVCAIVYPAPPTLFSYQQHCRSQVHHYNVVRAGLDFLVDEQEPRSAPENSRFCTSCKTYVPYHIWQRHIRTRKHLVKAMFHATKAAQESTAGNKHSVEISGDEQDGYNFGVLEPGQTLVTLPIDIELTSPTRISLVDIQLMSQTSSRRFRQETPFIIPPFRGALKHNQTRTLNLKFSPKELGRFDDRLEFTFRDETLGERFVIARYVRAVVANQRELEALGPVAPFRRPPRRRFEDRGYSDVDGIQYPFESDIIWKAKLAPHLVPASIQRVLSSGSPQEQIEAIRTTILPPTVNASSYSRNWSSLLHLEEVQMTSDISAYDMEAEPIERLDGGLHKLRVPGLAEKRPSIILGDKIRVRVHGRDGPFYAGYVHMVEHEHVLLKFNYSFSAVRGQRFDVRFTLNRSSLRRMHQALAVAWNPERILFPSERDIEFSTAPTEEEISDVRLVNRYLESNPSQKLAVTSILNQPPGSIPFIIFGPPGTGKTVVAVEAIRQILMQDPNARILAAAPSNSAADLLADRLKQQGTANSEIFRLNAPTRPVDALSKSLEACSRKVGRAFVVPTIEELRKFRVIVATCITASLPYAMGAPRGHFSHIFIDEAGQALEPEAMIPIRTMAGPHTNIVLSGDPQQLGPIVRSRHAIACGLGVSYLDRLMNRPIYNVDAGRGISVVKLVQNFRSHQSILDYPNRRFYRNELVACADPVVTESLTRFHELVTPGFPIIFHSISGEDMREASSPSFFNPHEVLVVKRYVQALREDQRLRLLDSQIGVISPYNAQNGKIRKTINAPALKKSRPGVLKVGSVEEFQGQERRVIIVSTVRSNSDFVKYDLNHTLGFVANPRRFNVAMTRAQSLLIIVGDPVILSLDQMWRNFLDYIHASGGWRGKPRDWDDEASVQAADFLLQRRRDTVNSMDELARRLRNVVIDDVEDGDVASENGDDGGQDRPWREDE